MKFFGAAGAVGLFLAVLFGAFGAHSLRGHLTGEMLAIFETGVRYQMYHSISLIVVAFLYDKGKLFKYAGMFYVVGIFLFSGSLYMLALTNIAGLGIITPFGGLSFLAGHFFLVVGFLKM
jgi:uncharacterized membrane protein YgdD (TMEM256/DUF423 family)